MYCMPAGSPVIQVWYSACLYSAGVMPGTAVAPTLAILTASSEGASLLPLCAGKLESTNDVCSEGSQRSIGEAPRAVAQVFRAAAEASGVVADAPGAVA